MSKKTEIRIRLNNYKIRLIQFGIIFLCVSIFIIGGKTNAITIQEENYTNIFNKDFTKIEKTVEDSKDKKGPLEEKKAFNEFIKTYCNDRTSQYKNQKTGTLVFDARKSIFLYTLCSNVLSKSDIIGTFRTDGNVGMFLQDEKAGYIKHQKDKDGKTENLLDKKLPNYYNNTEDYIKKLFDNIIASYTTIYQANIYGITGNPEETEETLIDNFGARYYNYPIDKNTPFLSICATDRSYSFPKTCKKMKEYIKSARNTLNNSDNILNSIAIYNKIADKEDKKKICNDKYVDKYDIISCGLYTDINSFSNLVYNELLFYSAFVEYYNTTLNLSPQFRNGDSNNISKLIEKQQERIDKSYNNLNNSRKAIGKTVKMLMDLQMTFPIHIGLLIYSESVNNFATEFVKTLTPIYTMPGIFQNVQIKKE